MIRVPAGGYAHIPGVPQYFRGVRALPGFRTRFAKTLPLAEGFHRAAETIKEFGRSLTALCAAELRSPAPFTEGGFGVFNAIYQSPLAEWGVVYGTANPGARRDVCHEFVPPPESSFHAFAFTLAKPYLISAGSGEAGEGHPCRTPSKASTSKWTAAASPTKQS